MAVIGDLVTRLSVDGRNFQNGLSKAQGQAKSFASNVASIVGGIAIADIGGKAIGGILSLGQGVAKLAADAQMAQIQFEVLTGSAEKGAALFKDVERFAARTSFNLESAAEATRTLLATGVKDSDIIPTMQLLGDLAMGDSEKMKLVAKAYTDVLSKGKLQAQELRQFAENGVNVVGALAAQFKKSRAEIMEMSSSGEISFQMMQEALLSLTGEGGRFNGMMERMNATLTGQWNSLIENVQTLGREIGTAVLPSLTSMVTVANEILQKFNMLPDKMKFLSDVMGATWDVIVENVKVKWDEMLASMIDAAWNAGKEVAAAFNPVEWGMRGAEAVRNRNAANANAANAQGITPLQAAQNRLSSLIGTLQGQQLPAAPSSADLTKNLPKIVDGSGLTAIIGKAMEKAAPAIAGIKQLGMTKAAEWQTWGQGLSGTLSNWLGGDANQQKEKQSAGAMFAGQADAFSTVVAAMFGPKQDPLIKETKNQTNQIVKAIKETKPASIPVMLEFLT